MPNEPVSRPQVVSLDGQYERFTEDESRNALLEELNESLPAPQPAVAEGDAEGEEIARTGVGGTLGRGIARFSTPATSTAAESSADDEGELVAVSEDGRELTFLPSFSVGGAREVRDAVFQGGVNAALNIGNTVLDVGQFAAKLGPEGNFAARGIGAASEFVENQRDAFNEMAPEAQSLAGVFAKNLTQWYVGHRLVRSAKLDRVVGRRGAFAAETVVPGAIAFDPYEERLSSMLKDGTLGPIFSIIAPNPEDSELVARAKATAEEALLGGVFEAGLAITRGVKLRVRARRRAVATDADEEVAAAAMDAATDHAIARGHVKDTKRMVGLVDGTGDGSERVLTAQMKAEAKEAADIRGAAWEDMKASPEFKQLHPELQRDLLDIAEPRRPSARPENAIAAAGRRSLARIQNLPNGEALEMATALAKGDPDKGVALLGDSFNAVLIDGSLDAKAALGHLSDRLSKHLPEDLRSPRSFARSEEYIRELGGRDLGDTLRDLAGAEVATRRAGELMMAGEMALKGATRRLRELAREIVDVDPQVVNRETVEEYLRLSDGAAAIYNSLKGTQTNVARALNLRKLRSNFGDLEVSSGLLDDAIDAGAGGMKQVQAMAHRMLTSGGLNDRALLEAAADTGFQKFAKGVRFFALSSMLSGIKTQVVNIMSNTFQAVYEPVLDGVTTAIERRSLRDGMGVVMAEFSPVLEGGMGILKAVAQASRGSTRLGATALLKESSEKLGINAYLRTIRSGGRLKGAAVQRGDQLSKFDVFDTGKLDDLGIEVNSIDALDNVSDRDIAAIQTHWVRMVGKAFLPGTQLSAFDAMFTEIAAQMGMRREGAKAALAELGPGARIGDVMERARNFESNIGVDAADKIRRDTLVPLAKARTFQTPLGEYGRAVQKLSEFPILGKLVLPFVRTPTNLLKYAHANTPIANLASKKFLQDVLGEIKTTGKLGPKGAEFLARSTLGGAMWGGAIALGAQGRLQGQYPNNPAERKAMQARGIPEYSVNIGGKWVAFNRLDPFGMFFGVVADAVSYHRDLLPEDQSNIAKNAVLGIAKNLSERNYLMGLTAVFDAMSDPDKHGAQMAQNYINLLVPNFFAQINQREGQVLRDTRAYNDDGQIAELRQMLNGMIARIPGQGDVLPARRNVFGVQHRGPTVAIALNAGIERQSPVLNEMMKQGVEVDITEVQRRGIQGVRFNGSRRDFYGELITDTKRNGQTLQQALLTTIKSPEYRAGTDRDAEGNPGLRTELLKATIKRYVDAAKADMVTEFPDIIESINEKQVEKMEAFGIDTGESSPVGSTSSGQLPDTINALLQGNTP